MPTLTPTPLPTLAPEFWATVGVAADTLIALQTITSSQELGDIAVMSVDGTHYQQLTNYGYNRDPRLSPNRQRIAYRSVPLSIVSSPDRDKRLKEGNYNLWIITVDGAQAWKLTDSEQPRSIPDWSPDSRKVLFSEGAEGALIEIEVDTQARREIMRGAYSPRYRPGGGVGYLTEGGGLAWIDEALTTHSLVSAETLPSKTRVGNFVWLQDGQHVIYTVLDEYGDVIVSPPKSSVWIIDVNEANPTQLVAPTYLVYDDLPLSADNRFIAARAYGYGDACAPNAQIGAIVTT
jgi:dipeptidyl aminopeptidase/acylaminoacyl peptidase